MLHALIMAGGGGTRFWPRSRIARPKQFLSFGGERSLIQQAWDRVEAMAADHTWVITGSAYCEETRHQLPSLAPEHLVGEPCGRDTAPCIGLGAALIAREDPEAMMMVLPADHVIEPEREFARAAKAAQQLVVEHPDALITFGIPPTFPSTGYGYIHRAEPIGERQAIKAYGVEAFKEKPKKPAAEVFVATGEYFWNGGIFVWKAKTLLQELQQHKPKLYEGAQEIAKAWGSPNQEEVLQRVFPTLEKISIDFAVMEKAKKVLVIETPFQWDDVGSWLALERHHPQDANGNTIQGNHQGIRTKGSIIVSDESHLVATIGVEHLLIVQDGNVTLVADRRDESSVKQLVELLGEKAMEKYL